MPRPRIKADRTAGPAARRLLLLMVVVMVVAAVSSVVRAFVPLQPSSTATRRRYHMPPRPLPPTVVAATAAAATSPAPHAPPPTPTSDKTLLDLSPSELAAALGGNGRARMVWRALAEGFDPHEADPASPLCDARITAKTRALLQQRLARPAWAVVERMASRYY